jgi:hypothetical protein
MKKTGLIFILSIALTCGAYAQTVIRVDDLPVKIRSAFGAKFPNATEWLWSTMGRNNYSATFKVDNMRYYAETDTSGTITLLRNDIDPNQLPAAITSMIRTSYPNHKIEEAERMEDKGVVTYEVEIEGKPDYEFTFDAQGKMLTKKLD